MSLTLTGVTHSTKPGTIMRAGLEGVAFRLALIYCLMKPQLSHTNVHLIPLCNIMPLMRLTVPPNCCRPLVGGVSGVAANRCRYARYVDPFRASSVGLTMEQTHNSRCPPYQRPPRVELQ